MNYLTKQIGEKQDVVEYIVSLSESFKNSVELISI